MLPTAPLPGRGAATHPIHRYTRVARSEFDDGWSAELEDLPPLKTTITAEQATSVISRNQSPDVPFEQSVNPYRGCEHGCVYCFARPSHAWLDLSPGRDFETRLFYKANAVEQLEAELRQPKYVCKPLALGINTDAYQPIEKQIGLTRRLLELLLEYRHPVSIVTKGITILRDLDLLEPLARQNLVSVTVSLTTLNDALKRRMEPRTASPAARLKILCALKEIGIAPGVLVAPVIPQINDREIEAILDAAAAAGARRAGFVALRLPHELKGLFREWLEAHYPERAAHVMSLIRQMRGGKEYDATYGSRMRGTGALAVLLHNRFRVACRRLGLNEDETATLDTSQFRRPLRSGDQIGLF